MTKANFPPAAETLSLGEFERTKLPASSRAIECFASRLYSLIVGEGFIAVADAPLASDAPAEALGAVNDVAVVSTERDIELSSEIINDGSVEVVFVEELPLLNEKVVLFGETSCIGLLGSEGGSELLLDACERDKLEDDLRLLLDFSREELSFRP